MPTHIRPALPLGAALLLGGLGHPALAATTTFVSGPTWSVADALGTALGGATPDASLAEFSFSRQFTLSGAPTAGTISVAVDDMATVFVNGSRAGSIGSITDIGAAYQAQSSLTSFNIAPYLVSGQNTSAVEAQNGPDSFAGARRTAADGEALT